MIPFNRPPYTGQEDQYVQAAMRSAKMSGDGAFTERSHHWFREQLKCDSALLTPSGTQALEMAAILLDLEPGDEVIMPSYTFVSTANAFALRGAQIVFVDIRPDTMNIDENLIEAAITAKTRAIVVVHYAGVSCEMDPILALAERHGLKVIEDAAQGMMSTYKGRRLGAIGHLGAYSFHETKNYTSGGEGGLLIVNDPRYAQRAEIIREKGTNRSLFFRGMVDKYSWVDIGSSYLPSELQAAYLWGQLTMADEINRDRLATWNAYHAAFADLETSGLVVRPHVPEHCKHNGHMYQLKAKNLAERTALLKHLKDADILAVFHYVPLHSATAGRKYSRFHGEDRYTTAESERLIRLPFWYSMSPEIRQKVIDTVHSFYS
ncbi:TDP-4-keto-6-deoxy-D-glucose transaminase [Leptothrix cholodnii SP-6]|uniref:TDP-4-keto-6-deoxy-D-glucose transaminase n=1 Tax=Leptothrix cholodnii (strain ATCC 51168 / LMG 8142 / SP-6) TaxID=395495 RepID=B1XZR7_LEPCP|nr:dTDP-4-amino-4,6-dideoxygalactose transaminase [Leptothrix cholodnii]ACB32913.1 TDP-4-keto-6-deoxy-D-glucose transaminase [Leptothrix cholodnii SP-6]